MKKSILKITKLVVLVALVLVATTAFSQEKAKQGKKSVKKEVKKAKTNKKSVKTVCFKSNMTCHGCASEVKSKIAYEKGVKNVETDLNNNIIVVTYREDKNSKEKIAKAIKKLGYEAKDTPLPKKSTK